MLSGIKVQRFFCVKVSKYKLIVRKKALKYKKRVK